MGETTLKALALSVIAVLAPVHAIMVAAGFLIVADTVTGIFAARKRGEPFKSSIFRRSLSKMLIYQTAVITGFIVEKYMLSLLIPVSSVVAAAIGMVELTSIIENLQVIYGQNIFQSLIDRLGSKNDDELKKKIEELSKKLEKDK